MDSMDSVIGVIDSDEEAAQKKSLLVYASKVKSVDENIRELNAHGITVHIEEAPILKYEDYDYPFRGNSFRNKRKRGQFYHAYNEHEITCNLLATTTNGDDYRSNSRYSLRQKCKQTKVNYEDFRFDNENIYDEEVPSK
jgi:hypothetical protein